MISKKEAFAAVLHRKEVSHNECGDPTVDKISKKITENINRGFLCANLNPICTSTEILNVARSLEDLGYTLEDGILYWVYRD